MLARSILSKSITASLRSTRPAIYTAVRATHSLRDREGAFEKQWVNEEDEKLLRRLSSKLRDSQKNTATGQAKDTRERTALLEIVKKYNVAETDIQALIDWRHHHDF